MIEKCPQYDSILDRECCYDVDHSGGCRFARLEHNCARERLLKRELDAVTKERDRYRDKPWTRLQELGFEIDETGVRRQHVMEREIVALREALHEALDLFHAAFVDRATSVSLERAEELRNLFANSQNDQARLSG